MAKGALASVILEVEFSVTMAVEDLAPRRSQRQSKKTERALSFLESQVKKRRRATPAQETPAVDTGGGGCEKGSLTRSNVPEARNLL